MAPIYVEIHIAGDMDEVWEKTQIPDLHQRWDLRFTDISYLPRPDASLPQQFLYKTRLGFGIAISGTGESVGTRLNERQRTSALRFGSEDPKSLIREGSGYWQYEQVADGGVRFLTSYDYQTRFGAAGRLFDRLCFRPLLGWATAWSFDRLRLWIEQGIDPAVALQNSLIHALSRLALVLLWLYQGLVPKLLLLHPDEQGMMAAAGIPTDLVPLFARVFGLAEIAFALFLLLTWERRRALLLNIPLMAAATLGIVLTSPAYLTAAFNAVTLNVSVLTLALIGYLAGANLPSARCCLRRAKGS
jgi:hypothetical protein